MPPATGESRSAASHNPSHFEYGVVNLWNRSTLSRREKTVTPELLICRGLIREVRAAIKVLGDGD